MISRKEYNRIESIYFSSICTIYDYLDCLVGSALACYGSSLVSNTDIFIKNAKIIFDSYPIYDYVGRVVHSYVGGPCPVYLVAC
jgi:hypothetical protein